MNYIKYILLATVIMALTACSSTSDDIAQETYTVTGSVSVSDPAFWIDNQELAVGLFIDDVETEYTTTLTKPTGTEAITFTINEVKQGDYTCKVYVTENNQYKADLYSYTDKNINMPTDMGLANVTLLSYERVQNQIFSKCTQCHGGASGDPAAGLVLLADSSYSHLYNVQSTNSELLRVNAGDATNSFLMYILNEENLDFDHSASVTATTADKELVELWINNGAFND